MGEKLLEEKLTRSVIGAFFKVYNALRFGFVEHNYAQALTIELVKRGHRVEREKSVTVFYEGEPLSTQRMDMIVDDRLVIEIKSTAVLSPYAIRQLHNYLRATDLELGLLLHFGPKAKFYRVIVTNDRKTLIADQADLTDLTDFGESSSDDFSLISDSVN